MKQLLSIIVIVLVAGSAQGQDGLVYMHHVTGLLDSGLICPGYPVTFSIGVANNSDNCSYGPANGFRIWSPDGATWTYPYADTNIDTSLMPCPSPPPVICTTIDTTIAYAWVDPMVEPWIYAWFISYFSYDGTGADTVGFLRIHAEEGFPPGFDGPAYQIPVQVRPEDTGKHICIDSSWYPPVNAWKWAGIWGPCSDIVPDWGGPYCFAIADCSAVPDTDGDGIPDVFDICPGFDDLEDWDGDKIPDGCDSAVGDEGAYVSLDHVDGLWVPDTVAADVPLVFHIRMNNASGWKMGKTLNGFRIYSPDGATWSPPQIDTVSEPGDWMYWGLSSFSAVELSVTGSQADTLAVEARWVYWPGFPSGFDGILYEITTSADGQHVGKTICLDAAYLPFWWWSQAAAGYPGYFPIWDGPYCFTITNQCCLGGMTGNVDYDPDGIVDISDVTALIDYLFISHEPPVCPDEANVDGDPEVVIDIGDLTPLINYLFIDNLPPAPCP